MHSIQRKLNIVMPEIKAQFPEIAKMVDYKLPISNDTFEKAIQGDINSRNLIIMKYIPHIVYWAYTVCKYFKKMNMFEDEVSNTIIRAYDFFQNAYKSKTYMSFCITIYRRLLPKIIHDLFYKDLRYPITTIKKPIHTAITQLFGLYGYADNLTTSDIVEISSITDISMYQIYSILYPYKYLDESCDEFYTEENHIRYDCLIEEISDALSILTILESGVLILRFGLSNECYQLLINEYCKYCKIEPFKVTRPHTLEEIGELIHVSRERVRQIEVKALRKLRHPSRGESLHEFYDEE